MAETDPRRIAKLIVGGREYTEWESIWVQERWTESFSYFRFTANEGRLQPPSWRELQFYPGIPCRVELGGQPIINGHIITRQASANATQHMVQHTGKSMGFWPYKSSVDTDTGSLDNKTISQIADIVFKKWGGWDKVGDPTGDAAKPIKKAQVQKGETTWDFMERLARQMPLILGVHRSGRPLLIFEHTGSVAGRSVEDGVNILQIQCTISIEHFYAQFLADSQEQGDDQTNGSQASQVRGVADGDAPVYSVLIVPTEQPMDKPTADRRAAYERIWNHATEITANITVPGWFSQDGMLWEAGTDVSVFSPISMITQAMKINTVTFNQDNNTGTTTTLECVAPWGRLDSLNIDVGPNASIRPNANGNGAEPLPPDATGNPGAPPSPSTTPTLGQQLGLGSIGFQFPDQNPNQ